MALDSTSPGQGYTGLRLLERGRCLRGQDFIAHQIKTTFTRPLGAFLISFLFAASTRPRTFANAEAERAREAPGEERYT